MSRGQEKDYPEVVRKADVIIAVLGLTSGLEGEEMPISIPGFAGGDRTSIDLPQAQEDLLKDLVASGKPVVLVLMNGSALAVNWPDEHVPAILEAWYPGERRRNRDCRSASRRFFSQRKVACYVL